MYDATITTKVLETHPTQMAKIQDVAEKVGFTLSMLISYKDNHRRVS